MHGRWSCGKRRIRFSYIAVFIVVVVSIFSVILHTRFYRSRLETRFSQENNESIFKQNNSALKSQLTSMPINQNNDEKLHVMFIVFNINNDDRRLHRNVQRCLTSLFETTKDADITIHVFGDENSFVAFRAILHHDVIPKNKPEVIRHDINNFPETMRMMQDINNNVSKRQHSFSHPYFYLALFMHKLLPNTISKLIILDADLVIKSDITKLFTLSNNFSDSNVIGIAHENQPTYRYMFYEFRSANPRTRVGGPPPNGLTGFNSGVMLLDLARMRKSSEYNNLLNSEVLASLCERYKFQGNLGDQDVFTLMSLEYEHLFYILPCGWNRQLCKWWQKADFEHVFDRYFACDDKIHILHGNCRSAVL